MRTPAVEGRDRTSKAGTGHDEIERGVELVATDRVLHRVFVRNNAQITVPASAETALGFDVEEYDTDGYHDNVTNNTRITVPAFLTGWYFVSGRVVWVGTAGQVGTRRITIRKNGLANVSDRIYLATADIAIGAKVLVQQVSGIIYLAATQYIELLAFQDEAVGVNVDTGTTTYATGFQAARLGAG